MLNSGVVVVERDGEYHKPEWKNITETQYICWGRVARNKVSIQGLWRHKQLYLE